MAKKLSQIVEEQIREWRHRNALDNYASSSKEKYPVITISREFGARGAALAEVLGREIDFKVWDKELLQAIAKELGSDNKFLKTLDERRRQAVEDTVAGFLNNIQTNVSYLRSLIRVVKTIEEHGNGIIVGRGANFICQNPASFHVRVVCRLKDRIVGYAERENLRLDEVRHIVEQKDRERAEFINRNFHKDVSAPSEYDLLINSKTFSLEEMAALVQQAYEKKTGKSVVLSD